MLIDETSEIVQDSSAVTTNETQTDKGGFKIRIFLDSARIEVSWAFYVHFKTREKCPIFEVLFKKYLFIFCLMKL